MIIGLSERGVLSARKKALFREGDVPPGAVCVSSFVAVTSGRRILVGKMSKPDVWVKNFFVGERFAPDYAKSGKYLLPASHLAWYESPLDAAARVMREQLLLPVAPEKISLLDAQSHVSGDVNDSSHPPHWDLCLLYQVKLSESAARRIRRPEWFEDFGFRPLSGLSVGDFARGHGDVLEVAGLVGRRR